MVVRGPISHIRHHSQKGNEKSASDALTPMGAEAPGTSLNGNKHENISPNKNCKAKLQRIRLKKWWFYIRKL